MKKDMRSSTAERKKHWVLMGVRGKEIICFEIQSAGKKFPMYHKLLKSVRYLVRKNTRLPHF